MPILQLMQNYCRMIECQKCESMKAPWHILTERKHFLKERIFYKIIIISKMNNCIPWWYCVARPATTANKSVTYSRQLATGLFNWWIYVPTKSDLNLPYWKIWNYLHDFWFRRMYFRHGLIKWGYSFDNLVSEGVILSYECPIWSIYSFWFCQMCNLNERIYCKDYNLRC